MITRFMISALVAAGLAVPALAQQSDHTVYVIADKATRASHAKLMHRIAVAVEEVCGSYGTIESYQVPEMDSCRKRAPIASSPPCRQPATSGSPCAHASGAVGRAALSHGARAPEFLLSL
jgi:UrcA family protein